MKKCAQCNKDLELSEFDFDKKTSDNLKKRCNKCIKRKFESIQINRQLKLKDTRSDNDFDEQWLPVVGWEEFYEVSNNGRIYSKITHKLLCTPLNDKGYPRVKLRTKENHLVYKTICTHRLVAMAFIENPESKPDVDHINNNRADPRVSNLQWVTTSENMKFAFERGSKVARDMNGENGTTSCFDNNQVIKMRMLYKNGIKVKELCDIFKGNYKTIWGIVNNKYYKNVDTI